MVRAYRQEHTYKHPWERVTAASWRKFADAENKRTLSHILEVDTLSHRLEPSSGHLYTTRAITIHAPGPWFVRKIIGQDICHCVESTLVDAKSRSMQLATRNISLQKFIEVEERIRYDPHPENPNEWTICRQETSIMIKPLSALASMAEKIEQRCVDKFQKNSAKGRDVMERICKYLEAESRGSFCLILIPVNLAFPILVLTFGRKLIETEENNFQRLMLYVSFTVNICCDK